MLEKIKRYRGCLLEKIGKYFGLYDLLIFAGIVSISYGIYQIYVPGMYIFAGVSLVLLGKAGD